MLELYHDVNAVCCQKVEVVLLEKELEYTGHRVALFRSEQYDPEYLKVNPRGYVPALVHDGKTVIESTLICEYLDEAFPTRPLQPGDPHGRTQMRMWSKLVDEELHTALSVLSFSAMFRDRMLSMPIEEREKRFRNVGNPIRQDMYMSAVEHGVASPYCFRAIASLEIAFRDLEDILSGGGPWVTGDVFSLAETNMIPYVARLDYLTLLDIWLKDRPQVKAWWERIKTRPSYEGAISGPLSSEEVEEMRASGERIHGQVAERRDEYLSSL